MVPKPVVAAFAPLARVGSTESESSSKTINPKSSLDENGHATPKYPDPDDAAVESATGTSRKKEEDTNGPNDGEGSSARSERSTRSMKRLRPTEENP